MEQLARNLTHLMGDTPQDEYAKAVGVSQSTISRAIRRGVAPSLETVMAIARHHRILVDDLLTRDLATEGPSTSHHGRLPEGKLARALVAVDRALESMHLSSSESWGKLAGLVIWAIDLQESEYPNGINTKTELQGFDAQVEVRMRREAAADARQARQDAEGGHAKRARASASRSAPRGGD